MKRSEMLVKIADIVHSYRRATEGVTSDQLAHMILEMQEAHGMLPPDFDHTVFGWNEGYISPPKWEQE